MKFFVLIFVFLLKLIFSFSIITEKETLYAFDGEDQSEFGYSIAIGESENNESDIFIIGAPFFQNGNIEQGSPNIKPAMKAFGRAFSSGIFSINILTQLHQHGRP